MAAWILVALGAAAAGVAALGLMRVGVAWDIPLDVQAAIEIRTLPSGLSKEEAYAAVYSTSELYGILVIQLADGLRSLLTASSGFLAPESLDTYRWLGAVNLVISAFGAAGAGVAVGVVMRSALAGAFTWALTMSTPLYFGMSFVDIKDVPVASGVTLFSAGLVLSFSGPSARSRWVFGLTLSPIGAIIAMGTRPGIWPALTLLSLGSLAVFGLWSVRQRRLHALIVPGVSTVAAATSAAVVLWLTNPLARIDLPRWLFDAFSVMRGFTWPGTVRVNGQDFLATELPWWYVPAWVLAQAPLLTLAVGAVTFVVIAMAVTQPRSWLPRGDLVRMTPFFMQGVVLPLVIVGSGSTIYDGLRHVLFMIPALIALMSIGVAGAERWVSTSGLRGARRSRLRFVTPIAVVVVVLASLWASVRWVPYSYAFVNPLAGWSSTEQDWDLDYWGVTAIEGAERLRDLGFETIAVEPTQITSSMVGSIGESLAQQVASDEYGLYVFRRFDASPGTCEVLFQIKRDRQVLGEGARCVSLGAEP